MITEAHGNPKNMPACAQFELGFDQPTSPTDVAIAMPNHTAFSLSNDCASGTDKREHKRLPFTTDHKIAPYRGETVPAKEFFFPVACHDISQGGFSFVIDRLPTMHKIVLGMTVYGESMYVKARIVNHRQRSDGQFIVGCKFLGRLQ